MCCRSVFRSDPAVFRSQVCPLLSMFAGRLPSSRVPSAPNSPHLNPFLTPLSTTSSTTLAGVLS